MICLSLVITLVVWGTLSFADIHYIFGFKKKTKVEKYTQMKKNAKMRLRRTGTAGEGRAREALKT